MTVLQHQPVPTGGCCLQKLKSHLVKIDSHFKYHIKLDQNTKLIYLLLTLSHGKKLKPVSSIAFDVC